MRALPAAAACLALAACSRENNLLLGRVQAQAGPHTVIVTDCYRTSPPQPQTLPGRVWHYAPCRDADVWIRDGRLLVNGRDYGAIGPSDTILVDHGVVSVHRRG